MKILIYAINFAPELTGCGKYTGEMGKHLVDLGHSVRVITAPPYYPAWEINHNYKNFYMTEEIDGCKVYRSPLYVPRKTSSLKRLVHLFSFALSSLPQLFRHLFWRPHIVMVIEPTFFCSASLLLFSLLSGSKSWLHVQDFELDAMLGFCVGKHSLFALIARKMERVIMNRFHEISSISNSMVDLLQQKRVTRDKTVLIPNWVDTTFISPEADRNYYRKKWRYAEDDIIFLYSGNIGKKQGLEILIPVARSLLSNKRVHFVIVGQGNHKTKLCQIVEEHKLTNMIFHDLQPYEKLPDLLRMADFHLVLQRKGAASAVFPSKLSSILSAGGTPIITAEEDTELGRFAKENPNTAMLIPADDSMLLSQRLQELVKEYKYSNYNHNARSYAEEKLSLPHIMSKLQCELERLLQSKSRYLPLLLENKLQSNELTDGE